MQSSAGIDDVASFHGCLIDLDAPAPAGMAFLKDFLARYPGPEHPTVGYLSHVNQERASQARELGCGEVLPRSSLAAEMDGVLGRLTGEVSS